MIEYRQAELDEVFKQYAREEVSSPSAILADQVDLTQEDKELIARISESKKGGKFRKLFEGDFSDYESQSEADFALCSMLAFWCRNDADQMDRIFRQSGLHRDKWDELRGKLTYGQITRQKAIDKTENVYGASKAPTKKVNNTRVFKLVQAGMIEAKSPQWLIRDWIERDSLALVFGDPACGKSFWSVDAALCVATGSPFHGHEVKQGPVIYIAGEGHNGLKRRMIAWSLANRVDHDTAPLFMSQMPAALTDADMLSQVQAAIELVSEQQGPPVLIVIDTLARNFGPGDENSTKDMSQFIQAVDALRASSQAAVLIVHHAGHSDKGRARGAMALKGALDAEYRLDKDETGVIRMEATKMKDAKYPEPCAFRIQPVLLPIKDSDGESVFGAVLESTAYAPPPSKGKTGQGKHQTRAMEILRNLQTELRKEYSEKGRDPGTARVSMEDWKKAMKKGEIPQKRISEVVRTLRDLNMITEGGGFVSPL